jgi:hypothetical protein
MLVPGEEGVDNFLAYVTSATGNCDLDHVEYFACVVFRLVFRRVYTYSKDLR